MAREAKIVGIGVGSKCFGPTLKDFFLSEDFRGCTLVLVDIDATKLEHTTQLVRRWNEYTGLGMRIDSTTDFRQALDGAHIVLNSIAIERCNAWFKDFFIPNEIYGLRQTLGENGGPGGLFFTLRTLPVIFDFVHEMERKCPRALFVNFSNPESKIICALGKYSKIRAVGLCHGIFMSKGLVSHIMGIPYDEIDVRGAGINHFQWLTQITRRTNGEDLYPILRAKERAFDPNEAPLTRTLFRAFDLWPTCSDGHTGEYLPYGWQGDEHTDGYDFDHDDEESETYARYLREAATGVTPAHTWLHDEHGNKKHSGEKAAEVIAGIIHDRNTFIDSGVVYNKKRKSRSEHGYLPQLPRECAVEVPLVVNADGVNPVCMELPEANACLLKHAVSNQQLCVEAAVHADKKIALQALLCDPVVDDIDAAKGLLEDLWKLNERYIRKCV